MDRAVHRSSRKIVPVALAIGAFLLLALIAARVAGAPASESAQRELAAANLVKHALHYEIDGQALERNDMLQAALRQSPEHAPALWHSGHVKLDNKWLKFDEAPLGAGKALLSYRNVRQKYPDTAAGQLALADWCARRRLADQERAHLTRTVELDPQDTIARERLGFTRAGSDWISAPERQAAATRAEQAALALKTWTPKLQRLPAGLARGHGRAFDAADAALAGIQSPDAIPALENVLSTTSEPAAAAVVRTLARISGAEGSLALARQAVFSPWPAIRQSAGRELVHRQPESFIPALLAEMHTPVQSRMALVQGPGGRLMYTHAFVREKQARKELLVLETAFDRIDEERTTTAIAVARAGETAADRETMLALQNHATQALNGRICDALTLATGENLTTPESWWTWWNDRNELYVAGDKPVARAYQSEQIAVATPVVVTEGMDCLAAGTPVWTDAGPLAIEKIQIGDRVLSQDPETAELAYKPVLRTTVRPAGRLFRISLAGESIETSGGHPLWVAGRGWVKARQIAAGAQLHGATASAAVQSVVPTGVAETYNLVVADFHTCFIGQARVLSHDNTLKTPTSMIVPGLPRK